MFNDNAGESSIFTPQFTVGMLLALSGFATYSHIRTVASTVPVLVPNILDSKPVSSNPKLYLGFPSLLR